MPQAVMLHEEDPKAKLQKEFGALNGLELFNNHVLVATYIRPKKTKSGIIFTDQTGDEDRFQGKVGLIVGLGPSAFVDSEGKWFSGAQLTVGDWVIYRASDGWATKINGVECRMLADTAVRGRVADVDMVY